MSTFQKQPVLTEAEIVNDGGRAAAAAIAAGASEGPTLNTTKKKKKKKVHTRDCCAAGRLQQLIIGCRSRTEDTHLKKMTTMAGYECLFVPKFHCGESTWMCQHACPSPSPLAPTCRRVVWRVCGTSACLHVCCRAGPHREDLAADQVPLPTTLPPHPRVPEARPPSSHPHDYADACSPGK